ncbi:MAG: Xaa-Pro peptidase family protein [Bacillota bacterium]
MSGQTAERLAKIRSFLKQNNLDAILITNPFNRRYLSGFAGTSGALLIGLEQAYLVTDFRYVEQAKIQATEFTVQCWKEDFFNEIALIIKEAGWERLGFESKHVIYYNYQEMVKKLPGELIPFEDAVERLRMFKNEEELNTLKNGARVLDAAFEYICRRIKAGVAEKELALDLEIYLKRQGAKEPSFRFIVASGSRGAMPHATASDKEIQDGELITLDFGGVFDDYATDMTRTVAYGEPGDKKREIYKLVKLAQEEARKALKPGLKGWEIDAVARDIFARAGYGEYFGHGLGHGVGLETHEQPVLNKHSNTVLEPGMVVTIEPGIYIPGSMGVRIEDMLCLTENGAEVITNSPRELIMI